jgi:preprotein translocase subunit SecD
MRRASALLFSCLLMLLTACDVLEPALDDLLRQSSSALVTRIVLRVDAPPESYTTEAVREAAELLRRRLNDAGVALPEVLVDEGGRIEVLLPPVADLDATIALLTQSGVLELVDFSGLSAEASNYIGQPIATNYQLENRLLRAQGGELAMIEPGYLRPDDGQPFATILTHDGLQAAEAQFDEISGQWIIAFELTPEAGERIGDYTEAHIGEPLAVVLNSVVLTMPIIQGRLDTGGVISGNFSERQARTLASQLRAGALRLPLIVESIESIAP